MVVFGVPSAARPNGRENLLIVGVTSRFLLRGNEVAVDDHLKDASLGGDDFELRNRLLELLEQPLRQTDGLRPIASDGAVFDRDVHDRSVY